MKALRTTVLLVCVGVFLVFPVQAIDKGTGRLVSVTPVDGGCVSGPTGATTAAWDVQRNRTYTLRIDGVTECANGGTDATLDVRVNSSIPGFEYNDLVATNVAPGVYEFNFTLPNGAWCTLPVFYCTTPGDITSGYFVSRHDGATNPNGKPYTAHLRASTFSAGCTNPMFIVGPECGTVPTEEKSWGEMKSKYQ